MTKAEQYPKLQGTAGRSDHEWEKYGKDDPYFGVVSLDKFHRKNLTDDALRQFFDSGSEHIQFVLDTARSYLDPDFSPTRALDFGCGVGRCTFPMAAACKTVVGVDVSESMLAEARLKAGEFGVQNVEFVLGDDQLSRVSGHFDIVHSFIVFQHIAPKRGEALFSRLVQILNDGGIGAVQVVFARDVATPVRLLGYWRKRIPLFHYLVNLAYRKPYDTPLMEKNFYDVNRLLGILQDEGCGRIHVKFLGKGSLRSVVLFFQKCSDPVPYDTFYTEDTKA